MAYVVPVLSPMMPWPSIPPIHVGHLASPGLLEKGDGQRKVLKIRCFRMRPSKNVTEQEGSGTIVNVDRDRCQQRLGRRRMADREWFPSGIGAFLEERHSVAPHRNCVFELCGRHLRE